MLFVAERFIISSQTYARIRINSLHLITLISLPAYSSFTSLFAYIGPQKLSFHASVEPFQFDFKINTALAKDSRMIGKNVVLSWLSKRRFLCYMRGFLRPVSCYRSMRRSFLINTYYCLELRS